MNYLHLAYISDKMNILSNDINNYFNNVDLVVLNSENNELKLKNKLNGDTNTNHAFNQFKKETGVDLSKDTYDYFMKNEYNNTFHKEYNIKVGDVFAKAEINTEDITVPKQIKISFLSKLFGKKQPEIKLESGIYNASMFNEIILDSLESDNRYIHELLKLNKFIIFKSVKYSEIKETILSPEFLSKYIEIKEFTNSKEFSNLKENDKILEIRNRFKHISEVIEKLEQ